jgi:hypothetical protein
MQDSFFDFNLVSWYKCDVHFYVHKGRKEFVTVSFLLTSALDSLLMRVQVGSARVEGQRVEGKVVSGGLKRKPHP